MGLLASNVFGASDPRTADYADELGVALQLTNIVRDVGEDETFDDDQLDVRVLELRVGATGQPEVRTRGVDDRTVVGDPHPAARTTPHGDVIGELPWRADHAVHRHPRAREGPAIDAAVAEAERPTVRVVRDPQVRECARDDLGGRVAVRRVDEVHGAPSWLPPILP